MEKSPKEQEVELRIKSVEIAQRNRGAEGVHLFGEELLDEAEKIYGFITKES